jgi:ATP phosphoribosyltransferase regulatory subunit
LRFYEETMNNIPLGLPEGYRDLLFDEAQKKRKIEARLAGQLEEAGYREIAPSSVEYLELYRRGNQNNVEHAVKFLDRNDDLLSLRADFTPSIARIFARRPPPAEDPVRVWYAGSVFRRSNVRGGRWSEFGQVGAECIGRGGGDAEILQLVLRLLESAGIHDAECHINHAGVFRGIVQDLSLEPEALDRVKAEIDHKNTRALAARLEALGVGEDTREQLRALSRFVGGTEVLAEARRSLRNPTSLAAVGQLETLVGRLNGNRVVVDLTEIDEMEYYTGVMFTLFSPRLNEEIGAGGRYDTLFGEFGAAMPAIGFSLSMDALMELVP